MARKAWHNSFNASQRFVRGPTPVPALGFAYILGPANSPRDLLLEKSREASLWDPRRGVRIAELARISLEPCAEWLGTDLPNREAAGWVRLGTALRLAEDYDRAELAYAHAETELDAAGSRDPTVAAKLCMYKGIMRWFQRRPVEAKSLAEEALSLYQDIDQPVGLARTLNLRGGLLRDTGRLVAAVTDYRRALELLGHQGDPLVRLSALTGLALVYTEQRAFAEAEKVTTESLALAQTFPCGFVLWQCQWTAGLVMQELGDFESAESLLRTGREGFSDAGIIGHTGVLWLDVALLYSEWGKPAEVLEAAVEALPLLEALELQDEALAALRLLRNAVAVRAVSTEVLQEVRDVVAQSQGNPAPRVRKR